MQFGIIGDNTSSVFTVFIHVTVRPIRVYRGHIRHEIVCEYIT